MTRRRPEDGGVAWHARMNTFECLGCGDFETVRSRHVWTNPERLAQLKELVVLDHTECWQYADAEKAQQAGRYRKARKRRELLVARAGRALDAQVR